MSKTAKQIVCMVFFMLVFVPMISVSALDNSASLSNAGGTNTTYSISSEADLLAIEDHLDANYVLSNSITLTSDNWQPLGATDPFVGTLDGRGYTISGLKISEAGYAGLFALNAGTIQNLIVEGDVSGSIDVGILAGNNSGNIQNCLVSGSVTNTGSGNAGGLVGSSKGNISYCGSTAIVTGGSGNVGGLVGYVNCHTGGPGADNPSVINCYAQGDVIGTSRTGGLIGYSNYQNNYKTWTYYGKVVIRNCYASGKVNDGMGGGLLGANNSYFAY